MPATLNIVLIEPRIPQNTGNVARTCAVTGARLHLVGPMGFEITDAKLKRAGLDYWHMLDITYYSDIDNFLSLNKVLCYCFETTGSKPYADIEYPNGAFLLFGREDGHLPERLLGENQSRCLRLPMLEGARSLNLSNAVAVVAYEVLRQWGYPGLV